MRISYGKSGQPIEIVSCDMVLKIKRSKKSIFCNISLDFSKKLINISKPGSMPNPDILWPFVILPDDA